ncbi:MAG: TonB-dependent receptor [bacterium]|nr:TonB-dependent receptor [bacterium]
MLRKILFFILSFGIFCNIFGQTTGKIRGTVTDKSTGGALPFANIVIAGTTLGAAADLNGEYIIVNVPVGTYSVVATMMGYDSMRVENVVVSIDMTTTVNFKLAPTVIRAKEVVVTAKRPIIERDVTASAKRMSGKEITQLPVTDYEDVIALQTGSVETGRSRSGGLHIRGGRADEVVYVVDGINTTDPVYGQSGAILDNNAISEMLMISGGFDAEYGNAMSGVVNVVTREGELTYGGGLKYTTDQIFSKSSKLYKLDSVSVFDQGYNFGLNDLSITLGGPLPWLKNATFFSSGGLRRYDSYLPHNDGVEQKGTLKLAWRLSNTIKTTLTSNYAYREYHPYNHAFSRGAWIDDLPLYKRGNSQINLKLTHTVSSKTFYTINVGRFNTYHKRSSQNGRDYHDFNAIGTRLAWVDMARDSGLYDPEWKKWKDGWSEERAWMWYYEKQRLGHWNPNTGEWVWDTNRIEDILDALNNRCYQTGTFLVGKSVPNGDSLIYQKDETTFVYYHKFNLAKYIDDIRKYIEIGAAYEDSIEPSGGLYMIRYNADEWRRFGYYFSPIWHDRNTTRSSASLQLTSQVNRYNEVKFGAEIEKHSLRLTDLRFINENPYIDHYNKEPITVDAYLSDKIEYEDMVLKTGIRFDYFDPRSSFYIRLDSLEAGREQAKPKSQFSPRLGISYSVTDKAVMYANYGHFFQPLNFADIYQNLEADITNGWPTIGNPNLPPQKEIMYEGGFRYAFTPYLAGEISAYYKDVKTLLSTRQMYTIFHKKLASYTIYKLDDFAVVKGIDLILRGPLGSISYSFQDAKGTGSSAREAFYFYYYYGGTGNPPQREYPLEYDITHTVKGNLILPLPYGLITGLSFSFMSGAPYTPRSPKGMVLELGSKRMPSTSNIDLRIDKGFKFGSLDFSLFGVVQNLLNTKNVVDVYSMTGKPDNDGDPPDWDPTYYESVYRDAGYSSAREMYEANLANWKWYCNDPTNYSNPRIINVGVELKF